MLELRQVIAITLGHLVDHLPDLGQRKYRSGQWVVGDGLEDQARVAHQRSFDWTILSAKLVLI